jgi:hypothetical protein
VPLAVSATQPGEDEAPVTPPRPPEPDHVEPVDPDPGIE